MSYSVTKREKSRAALNAAMEESLRAAMKGQAAHVADVDQVVAACASFVNAMPEPREGEVIVGNCYGHSGGDWSAAGLDRHTEMSTTVKITIVKDA